MQQNNCAGASMIDDIQIQQMILRQAEGARAMSEEDMARRQLKMVNGMYNAWPRDNAKGQEKAMNLWSCITQQHDRDRQ